ncbi:hypothetical protein FSOLCH5_007984 [Fusarium solani]
MAQKSGSPVEGSVFDDQPGETSRPGRFLSPQKSTKASPSPQDSPKATAPAGKKRLFVCCDGTWNDGINSSQPLTNVSRLARCVDHYDTLGCLQLVYYDNGVGNGTDRLSNSFDSATGRGISAKIRAAYSFLCHNYNADTEDEIMLVGFSRGSFTVQCVASMIHHIGLLKKEGLEVLPELFELWATQTSEHGMLDESAQPGNSFGIPLGDLSAGLERKGFLTRNVRIKACAVWDTVSALGSPLPQLWTRPLHFVGKCAPLRADHAFQALALNERRRNFKPVLWTSRNKKTQVHQCWFIGSHSDVGGGSGKTELATLALVWMIARLEDTTGTQMFNHDVLFNFMNDHYFGNFWNHLNDLFGRRWRRPKYKGGSEPGTMATKLSVAWWCAGVQFRTRHIKDRRRDLFKKRTNDRVRDISEYCKQKQKSVKKSVGSVFPTKRREKKEKDLERTPVPDRDPTAGVLEGAKDKGKGLTRSVSLHEHQVVALERSSQCVHFSVRLIMATGESKCHLLKKWATEPSVNGTRDICWKYSNGDTKYVMDEDKLYGRENQILSNWLLTSHKLGKRIGTIERLGSGEESKIEGGNGMEAEKSEPMKNGQVVKVVELETQGSDLKREEALQTSEADRGTEKSIPTRPHSDGKLAEGKEVDRVNRETKDQVNGGLKGEEVGSPEKQGTSEERFWEFIRGHFHPKEDPARGDGTSSPLKLDLKLMYLGKKTSSQEK